LAKKQILGTLVAFAIFFFDFGSKSGSGGGKASGKGKHPQNRKEIVNFSSFW